MKRTLLSVAVLVVLLMSSCSKTAMVPDQTQAIETSVLFGARASAGLVALPASTLPSSVKAYLDQHAPGYTLVRVEKMRQPGTTTYLGTKVTVLQNGAPIDYFFDTKGVPIAQPAGPRGELITRLTASQLPASVSSYLSQTYAGYQLVVAESLQLNGTAQEYRVQILTNNQRIDVHFDGSGAFRDAHTAPGNLAITHSVSYVSKDNLPGPVKTALSSSSYSAYTYGWAEQHVHDGTTTYDIKLFSNGQPVVLHLDAAGALVAPARPGGPAVQPPASGTAVGGPGSTTAITGPKPGTTPPISGTLAPPAAANHQIILDGSALPSAITAYLQANFSGYTFLAADVHTPPAATTGEYTVDLAVGQQLYTLRFSASGELLMAEARS